MDEELKPCPFCGGKNISYSTHQIGIAVGCDSCGAVCEIKGSKDQCAAAWNARAQLPSQGGEAVAWADPYDLKAGAVTTTSVRNLAPYTVPLYTHPADQVADPDAELVALLERASILLHMSDGPHEGLCATSIDAKLASLEVKP